MEVLQEAAGVPIHVTKTQIYICIPCLVPCSALPKSAVILRCFFLRYLLTPEVSLAARRRAAATVGEMCLNVLLSKRVQTGTILVSRDGTGTDAVVAVNSDKSWARCLRLGEVFECSDSMGTTCLGTADRSVTRHRSNIHKCLLSRFVRATHWPYLVHERQTHSVWPLIFHFPLLVLKLT